MSTEIDKLTDALGVLPEIGAVQGSAIYDKHGRVVAVAVSDNIAQAFADLYDAAEDLSKMLPEDDTAIEVERIEALERDLAAEQKARKFAEECTHTLLSAADNVSKLIEATVEPR